MLLEHLAVQVHADVSSHVLGADLQDLASMGRKSVRILGVASSSLLRRTEATPTRLDRTFQGTNGQDSRSDPKICAKCSGQGPESGAGSMLGPFRQEIREALSEEVTIKLTST